MPFKSFKSFDSFFHNKIPNCMNGMNATCRIPRGSYTIPPSPTIDFGLDFILSHFEEPVFPRTISTKTTEGRQVPIYSEQEALARFKQTNLLDCRINAYPYREDWAIELLGQTPNFIFIDEDESNFDSRRALDMTLGLSKI